MTATMTQEMSGVFSPYVADSRQPCKLSMQELSLSGRVTPLGGHLIVRHVFRCSENHPQELIYSFALPRDAALRRFRVAGKDFSMHSELKDVEMARQEYEKGVEDGHLSTLAQQYRDGVVNLNLGNIRPGEDVGVYLEILAGVESHDEGLRFRFPFTLAPTYHSRAKISTLNAVTGEMELPADEFGDVMLPTWKQDAKDLHHVGFNLVLSCPHSVAEVSSPSHRVRIVNQTHGQVQAMLANDADVPDRDLILDVKHSAQEPMTFGGRGEDGRAHFAMVVPSRFFGEFESAPRRVVICLDHSGSMNGEPLKQAKRAVRACLGTLEPADQFGLVAFESRVTSSGSSLMFGDKAGRMQADAFLNAIQSRGGTEMLSGMMAAFEMLGETGGEVFLVTDGQASGTEDIVAQAKPYGIVVHCMGIGSASQDRFLASLASQTGGVSRMVTPKERVDTTALELFAAAGRPLVSGLTAQVRGLDDVNLTLPTSKSVYSGTPMVVFGSAAQPGKGTLEFSWNSDGESNVKPIDLVLNDQPTGETIRLLRGAKILTDLEALHTAEAHSRSQEKDLKRRENMLRTIGREYGLANRLLALVAVVKRDGDQPGQLPRTDIIPIGMPEDTDFGAYFDARSHIMSCADVPSVYEEQRSRKEWRACERDCCSVRPKIHKKSCAPNRAEHKRMEDSSFAADSIREQLDETRDSFDAKQVDVLLELAGLLEADGGLGGDSPADRIVASCLALLAYAAENHRPVGSGIFTRHMQRLIAFLHSADRSGLSSDQSHALDATLEAVGSGWVPAGPWMSLTGDFIYDRELHPSQFWLSLQEDLLARGEAP